MQIFKWDIKIVFKNLLGNTLEINTYEWVIEKDELQYSYKRGISEILSALELRYPLKMFPTVARQLRLIALQQPVIGCVRERT